MSENERLLLDYKPLITSSIFLEMKSSSIDSVQIICKNGKSMNCSSLLLASISPLLADIIKHQDSQEYVILLPDIQLSTLKDVIDSILTLDYKQSKVGKEIFMLDGIFWKAGHLSKCFNDSLKFYNDYSANDVSKLEPIKSMSDLKDIFDEGCSDNLDNDVAHPLDDLDISTSFYSDLRIKEDISDEESTLNTEVNVTSNIPDNQYEIKDSFVKIEKLPKNQKVNCKKRKRSTCPKQNRKAKKVKENDCDKEENLRKSTNNIRKKNDYFERKGFLKRFLIPIKEESLDEDFKAAQEKLKLYLEDVEDFEVPRAAWCKFHGLNPEIYLLENFDKKPKLECPICLLSFSTKENDGRPFFNHLKSHKYKTYKCPCRPPGGFRQAGHEIKNHLTMCHWGWIRCQYCNRPVDPNHMKFHQILMHKEKAEHLTCPICQMTNPLHNCNARKYVTKYKMHIDDHTNNKAIKKAMCEICDIKYVGDGHRNHHNQVYHIGELLGCKSHRCYFTCKTQEEMNEHVQMKHINTKSENEQKHSVCDICGFVYNTKYGIALHKKKMHKDDLIEDDLIQCTKCPMKVKSIRKHMESHQEISVCTICGAKVKRMKNHMRLHIPYDQCKFKCEPCKRGFFTTDKLRSHMMSVHLKERPYSCRYGCEMAYNDVSNRNSHEKKKHGQLFSIKEPTEV